MRTPTNDPMLGKGDVDKINQELHMEAKETEKKRGRNPVKPEDKEPRTEDVARPDSAKKKTEENKESKGSKIGMQRILDINKFVGKDLGENNTKAPKRKAKAKAKAKRKPGKKRRMQMMVPTLWTVKRSCHLSCQLSLRKKTL